MLIDGFNAACKNIYAIFLKVGDESTSAIRFRTMEKGDLPHLSYISCNTKPLGKYSRTIDCYFTRALTFIEVQRGE